MRSNEKVILIHGTKSNWFEKAIFILKDSRQPNRNPKDLVLEAEHIVQEYMSKKYGLVDNDQSENIQYPEDSGYKEKKYILHFNNPNMNKILNCCIILSFVLLGYVIFQVIH